jgi:hypothetical protein
MQSVLVSARSLHHFGADFSREPETPKAPMNTGLSKYRHGDSNPGFRRERAAS